MACRSRVDAMSSYLLSSYGVILRMPHSGLSLRYYEDSIAIIPFYGRVGGL
jgi:hypothetical protein